MFAFLGAIASPIAGAHTFAVGDEAFLLDAKPFVIRCAEMHFARIPKPYWRHRLKMVRACGFNAVCAYMFWNYHEPVRGRYEFDGEKDVAEFCCLAAEEGLWVVLRPGPYTCAEWEFGGHPWWLLNERHLKLRSCDSSYLKPACEYLAAVCSELRENQVTRGGNILMVQIENEYGFWGEDSAYMRKLYEVVRSSGFDIPAFCCNPVSTLAKGVIPELLPVVNFGANPENAFAALRKVRASGPLMCGEYYPAWFDSWGERHNEKSADTCLADLEYMLEHRASFSVYMAHGGTSFAWWSGCNAPFRPQTSSYDYDAPVSEAGWSHPRKFAAMRELFSKHLNSGETIPEPPAPNPVQKIELFPKAQIACLFDRARPVRHELPRIESARPLSFEQAGLGYGIAIYSTTIPAGLSGRLKADVRDFGVVFVDSREVGRFDRRYPREMLEIAPSDHPRQLEILVDTMGRYNFGQIMHDAKKGIVGDVMLGDSVLADWTMTMIDLNRRGLAGLRFSAEEEILDSSSEVSAGTFFKYVVKLEAKDTFLDMRDWRRGMVAVNGHWLGRYWSIGPTQTMYVPGCWLKDGENEIIIWDAAGLHAKPNALRFLDQPILGEMHPETDGFALRPRPKLIEPLTDPVHIGEFECSSARQDVRFACPAKGRFFAFESLSSWDGGVFASGGELDLIDDGGKTIPHTKWTIAACDSEERRAMDGSAENLVDGQISNGWTTEWTLELGDHPHYVVIDLGQEETIGGFHFTPRQDLAPDVGIKEYRIYVSDKAWERRLKK